jgi:mono/diheme cytochrome c family protein
MQLPGCVSSVVLYEHSLLITKQKAMRTLSLLPALALFLFVIACGDGQQATDEEGPPPQSMVEEEAEMPESIAEGRGIGAVDNVEITDTIDTDMVDIGRSIYEMKCAACHKLTDQRVVGPGWAGITNKRKPEWIMNMITNVDVMLAEDPAAQALLEECLTRMPNQNISIGDARNILEFMRKNDRERVGESDQAIEEMET